MKGSQGLQDWAMDRLLVYVERGLAEGMIPYEKDIAGFFSSEYPTIDRFRIAHLTPLLIYSSQEAAARHFGDSVVVEKLKGMISSQNPR
jgi:hypothetical protein